MKGRRENAVQTGVIAYLQTRNDFWFFRANTGGAQFGESYVKFGEPGAADIQGAQAPTGRMVGIEIKRERGGVVSGDQERWGQNLTNHGGLYIVARGIEEVAQGLGPELARVVKIRKPRRYPR